MKNKNYTTTISIDKTLAEVFKAINNVRGWWSKSIEGDTDKIGSIFFLQYKDMHRATFKIAEFIPGKKVVWHVLQNYFSFVKESYMCL